MRQAETMHTKMGTMTNPSKFLFNMDFSAPAEPEEVAAPEPVIPTIPLEEHRRLLEQVKAQAFEEGRVKALEDLQTKQETLLTAEVKNLVQATGQVVETIDAGLAAQEQDAVSLAFLVARRLCSHLIGKQPLAETIALVSECLGPLRKAPHLVIRVAEQNVEALKAQIDPIVNEKGFEGRLVILGDPEITDGDCHIEWADGGIKRDTQALEMEIDGSIRSYLRARSGSKPEQQTKTAPEKEPEA